jgi:hypothetical protein
MIDLYSSMDEQNRKSLDEEKIHNIVFLILRNMGNEDNTVRLQGLRLLRLLVEDHAYPLSDISNFFFTASQELIQDLNRVIRNSALKLLSTIAAKVNFGIISTSICTLLESTYQYHEYSLRACSIAILHFISEIQESSSSHSNLFSIFVSSILSLASYASSIIVFSSEKISKTSIGDNSGFFSTYEASVDLFALCSIAKSIMDTLTKNNFRGIETMRQSSSHLIDNLVNDLNVDRFNGKTHNEIIQRMKSFSFPSLSDEVIRELAEKLIIEINQNDKSRFGKTLAQSSSRHSLSRNASRSDLSVNSSITINHQISSSSHSGKDDQAYDLSLSLMPPQEEYDDSLDLSKLSALKSTRKSFVKSNSSGTRADPLDLLLPNNRKPATADDEPGIHKDSPKHTSFPFLFNSSGHNLPSSREEIPSSPSVAMTSEESAPSQCGTPVRENFSRAANARNRRTKLKTPAMIETSVSSDEKNMNRSPSGSGLPGKYNLRVFL